MNEERDKVRCQKCELVQWQDRELCRRCGAELPEPIVKIVERVVERVIFQPASASSAEAVKAHGLSETASDFPTMAQMEQRLILAAYQRSNRRPLLAARLLGIGKTTMYRKLRKISDQFEPHVRRTSR